MKWSYAVPCLLLGGLRPRRCLQTTPREFVSTLGYNIYSVGDTVAVLIFSHNIKLKILLLNMIQERIHILCHRVMLIFVGN